MAKTGSRRESFGRHVGNAIFVNLFASVISAGAFFLVVKLLSKTISAQSTIKLLASVSAIIFWCISYGLACLWQNYSKSFKEKLKYLGYYFPPTTFFVWALDQRNVRLKAEEKLIKLEIIVNSMTDVRTIAGMVDPKKQKETLGNIIDEMDYQGDHDLARIVTNIRCYVEDIMASVGDNGNYELFRQVIEKLSLSKPSERPETCRDFLWLLSDIFEMPPKGCFTRQIQKDMIGPLKNTIWRVDQPNLNRVRTIIQQIMADEEDEHDLARQILEMLSYLDLKEKREVWQIIFDESKGRAFKFPQGFGFIFLSELRKLEHKVFWLDIQSLRDILEESTIYKETGLITLERKAYDELCSTVFAPLEDEKKPGIHNNRVFRRLTGSDGCVKVECELPDGSSCTCYAESLSFRGLYSKTCLRKVGEKLKAKLIPLLEDEKRWQKHQNEFHLSASVAKLYSDESSGQSQGRGIFFVDAEDDTAKGLYDYVSEHKK